MTRQATGMPNPRASELDRLLLAQRGRFRTLDPELGNPTTLPSGGRLIAARNADGQQVAGVLTYEQVPAGVLPSLWCAREMWTLYPVLGAPQSGPESGMDALLSAWRNTLHAEPSALSPDSACVLTWPSRDAEATRALLAHGMVPLSVLAVRPELTTVNPSPADPGIAVRRASPDDLAVALELSMAELEYSAKVGGAIVRDDARGLKRAALGYRLRSGDEVLLAERDGVVVGLAELLSPGEAVGQDAVLAPRRWGYLNCLSVRPDARGTGVGEALVNAAHERLRLSGMDACYLYYNPPNPLSSVFWPRHGYRPVWTIWELRPAGALR